MHRHVLAALVICLLIGAALVSSQDRPAGPPAPKPRAAEAAYRGNTNTHKFHKQACRYFRCPNCTAKFATRAEAIEAGYRPCGTCDP
jgi:hypothetical protein